METATLVAISISGLLVSFTGYALYTAFGKPSQKLRGQSWVKSRNERTPRV